MFSQQGFIDNVWHNDNAALKRHPFMQLADCLINTRKKSIQYTSYFNTFYSLYFSSNLTNQLSIAYLSINVTLTASEVTMDIGFPSRKYFLIIIKVKIWKGTCFCPVLSSSSTFWDSWIYAFQCLLTESHSWIKKRGFCLY